MSAAALYPRFGSVYGRAPAPRAPLSRPITPPPVGPRAPDRRPNYHLTSRTDQFDPWAHYAPVIQWPQSVPSMQVPLHQWAPTAAPPSRMGPPAPAGASPWGPGPINPVSGSSGGRMGATLQNVPLMRPPGQVAPHPFQGQVGNGATMPQGWGGSIRGIEQPPMPFGGFHPDEPVSTATAADRFAGMGLDADPSEAYRRAQVKMLLGNQMSGYYQANPTDYVNWEAGRRSNYVAPTGNEYSSAQTFNANGSPAGPASGPGMQESARLAALRAINNITPTQASSLAVRQLIASLVAEANTGQMANADDPNMYGKYLADYGSPTFYPPPGGVGAA